MIDPVNRQTIIIIMLIIYNNKYNEAMLITTENYLLYKFVSFVYVAALLTVNRLNNNSN